MLRMKSMNIRPGRDRPRCGMRRLLAAGAFTMSLACGQALAATIALDFDSPGTPWVGHKLPSPAFGTFTQTDGADPTVLAGGPSGNYLRLKGFERRMFTTVGVERSGPGAFGRIHGSFDFRITCFGGRTGFGCADGFAFAFLDTAEFGDSGQVVSDTRDLVAIDEFAQILDYDQPTSPAAPRFRGGLAIGIDHFEFGGDNFDPGSFRVRDGDTLAGGTTIADADDIVTGVNQTPGRFITLNFDVDFGTDLLSLSVVDGTNTVDVFTDLDISALGLDAFNSRLAFGTRSGDAGAAYDVDNINVQFVTAAAVPGPGSLPLAVCGLGLIALLGCRRDSTSAPAARR